MTVTTQNPSGRASTGGTGRVARVIGPVVDVEFLGEEMPEIYNALHVDVELADARWVGEPEPVHRAAAALGARLILAPLAVADGSPRHDPESLGVALVPVLGAAR